MVIVLLSVNRKAILLNESARPMNMYSDDGQASLSREFYINKIIIWYNKIIFSHFLLPLGQGTIALITREAYGRKLRMSHHYGAQGHAV